jgi:hypothetical protein
MICLNVPSSDETNWDVIPRRLYRMLVAISGPEFILTYASGQLGTSRDSVKAFNAIGHSEWTMQHGFFARYGRLPSRASMGEAFSWDGQAHLLACYSKLSRLPQCPPLPKWLTSPNKTRSRRLLTASRWVSYSSNALAATPKALQLLQWSFLPWLLSFALSWPASGG